MNTNITNPVKKELFTASITNEVPPRLSVEFGQGNSFKKDGMPCPAKVAVNATRKITVHLGNKTVANEAVGNLAAAQDCGRSLVLRQASQNSYDYVHDNEDAEGVNLSQITLQIQGSNLFAKFEAGGTGPVAPVMPGAAAPVPVGQAVGGVNAPANVQPAVAAPTSAASPVPSQDKLTGSLTGLIGTQWALYVSCLGHPELSYTAQYKEFLQKEKALLASQSDPFAVPIVSGSTGQ